MSPASLALPRTHPPFQAPDRARVTALSFAISVNLAVLLVALRPLPPAALPEPRTPSAIALQFHPSAPEPPPPPPLEVKPLPHALPTAAPRAATPVPVTLALPSISDEGTVPAPVVALPAIEPAQPGAGAAVEASLAYRSAPLHFPPIAIRRHMHGTVLLRVLVDARGLPQRVTIEHSSGYSLLDRSARDQVLKSWRFEPAMVAGRPSPAWARVPVSFDLRQL